MPDMLQVLLFPVIIDYMSRVTEEISEITLTVTVRNSSYKDEAATIFRNYRKELRLNIYNVLTSKKVLRKYPQIGLAMKLKYPVYQKCIIIMAGIDIEVNEICNVLQAGEDSISSQRSKRRKDIEQIFGRKPWMKE